MKKAFTLIELLAIFAIIAVVATIILVAANSLSNPGSGIASGYGRNIQRVGIDRTNPLMIKYHFIDNNTGEKFWSFDEQGDFLNRE